MAKLTLNSIGSRYGSVDALNDNFDSIENAMENTLSRDGTGPNAMEAPLDMNGFDLLNVSALNVNSLSINGQLVVPTGTVVTTLPTQTGMSGRLLTTNGTTAAWTIPTSAQLTFLQNGVGATQRTLQAKTREFVSVTDFGAIGNGIADDTAAIQAAVNASRRVYFPEPSAHYRCTAPIVLRQDTHIEGANKQTTVVRFFGCDGFTATSSGPGAYDIRIAGLSIIGNSAGTLRNGILIDGASANFGRVELENLVIGSFTRCGIRIVRPIVSILRLIQSSLNGEDGFQIVGDGTSVHADTCYAAGNTRDGWHIANNIQYSTFTSCASDGNGRHGYFFNGTAATPAEGITLTSCGSETNTGDQFRFAGTLGLTLNSIFTFPGSPSAGGHYINLDGCRNVVLLGIRMDTPAPAGNFVLNIGSLGGTQFPSNIRALGCSLNSINDPNGAYRNAGESSEAWIAPTFQNSWVNFGGSEATAGYYRDPFGVVHLKGVIRLGTMGSPAFTLPVGYRPAASRNFACASNSLFGYLAVGSNGSVTPSAGSNTWFSLDGVYWRADT